MFKKIIKKIKSVLLWEVYNAQQETEIKLNHLLKLAESQIQINQVHIALQYRALNLTNKSALPALNDTGFRVNSEFEEDGLLLYIFSVIGTTNKTSVEIGVADGLECNTANLLLFHGWHGLLIDGNEKQIAYGRRYYENHPNTKANVPVMLSSWVTRDNIDKLISNSGFNGEIDLLSIDLDGVDYYILQNIRCVKPRVIICEVSGVIPPGIAVTIPYSDDFYCWNKSYPEQAFRSMSLAAAVKLLKSKGYRFIGTHQPGFNAIFLLESIAADIFPEISVVNAYNKSITDSGRKTWNDIQNFPWVNV